MAVMFGQRRGVFIDIEQELKQEGNPLAEDEVEHFERLDLIGGQYYVNVGVHESNWTYAYDYHWHTYSLLIRPTKGGKMGVLYPPHRWETNARQAFQASVPTPSPSKKEHS